MPGIDALRKVQLGRESTAGTAVAATDIWRGMGVITDNTVVTYPDERIGIAGGTTRSYIANTGGTIALEGDATYEQLHYVLDASVYLATSTTDASSAFIRAYDVQYSSTDSFATTDLQTYTIEAGDNQQCEQMAYCFCTDFNLSGDAGADDSSLKLTANFEGRAVETTDFTAALSVGTVETILFRKGELYIDPTSDTIGTTQVSQTLFAMDFNMTTGWRAYPAADGRTDFSFAKWTGAEITCQVTFEHNATAVTEKAAWRNQTERAMRLKFTGNALATTDGGATYDTKTFIIDMWGKWESFDALSENEGNDQVVGTFRAVYSPTAGEKARFTIVNEVST